MCYFYRFFSPKIRGDYYTLELYVSLYLGLGGRVFTNGSIPGRVIPKTVKIVLDTSLLNTQQYKVHIKGKVEQSRERSSYWKRSLPVALDYSCQLYLLYLYLGQNDWKQVISTVQTNVLYVVTEIYPPECVRI